MNRNISPEKLIRISQIFHGFSNPVRLKILEILEDGKAYSVGEILKEIEIDPSLLSHHLTKMKFLGILKSYKSGRNIYYSLLLKKIPEVFDCIFGS